MRTKRYLPIGLAGGLALIAVFWQKFVHRTAKEEAMRGVKARTGGQCFSGRSVAKRQHSVGAGRVPALAIDNAKVKD